jgi:murein DD-endopeptidase MepM/ murein hydrolase activator NlpD
VKTIYILIFFVFWNISFSTELSLNRNDSVKTYKFISKGKLAHLIDSVFDLENVSLKDIDLLNYYASLLKSSRADSVKISEFNLYELSFYSQSDEKMLIPPTSFESIPNSFNLILENDYLSYYYAPFKGVVTSNYGWREGRIHKGIDIDLNKGDKVSAAFDGKVRFAKRQGGFGNVVILMHPNGLETVYAHLSKIKVKEGDVVLSGQIIGLGGSTGHSSGSHLHFELRYKGHPMNPSAFISFTDFKLFHHTITIKNSRHTLCAFPSNSSLHTVNQGESWNLIAGKYGLSTKELMALNGIGKRYYLKPGQQLRIN